MSRNALSNELRAIVGEHYVLIEKEDVIVYEQDGSIFQVMPEIVVLPANVEQVSAVIKAAKRANVPIVPRGSGTGLAGGAVPAEGGIVLSLARLDRILKIDLPNRIAIVEPGVINQDVTKAVAKDGFFYAPDPNSQAACSIGGNVANNSGGPHTLAYGVTPNHVLGVEVEGVREQTERAVEVARGICQRNGAREARVARDESERQLLWKGRKGAFGAMGALAPNYYVQDGVVPRSQLPEIMRRIAEISKQYNLRIANVFHAGDGNLHPNILFDMRTPGELDRVVEAGAATLRACIELGGSITGEHGIGIEKKAYIGLLFNEADLEAMSRVRKVFDPDGRFNPAKLFPTPVSCGEVRRQPANIPAGLWL